MKTAAIICEYDPFHNGHAYLIRKAKTELCYDQVICIMSGNFVQRGAPAVCDKYQRAKWALMAGADLVLEIPPVFAASSAREFAACAVRAAVSSGIVDGLLFGIEGNVSLEMLKEEAKKDISADSEQIRDMMKQGMTYPEALSASGESGPQYSSNNILAVEYLRELDRLHSSVTPVPVKRIGDPFSFRDPADKRFTSATAIRGLLTEGVPVSSYVPGFVAADLKHPVVADDLSSILTKALLTEPDLTVFHDVSREIAGRLANRKNTIMTFTERIADTKTRQYTYTRISRALLHISLGMREDEFLNAKENGYLRYLRILGLRKNSPVSSLLKKNADLPVIGRTAQYADLLAGDILYDQIYYSVSGAKGEFDRSPVVLDSDDI